MSAEAWKTWLLRGTAALLAINLALLAFYLFVGYQPYFNSDSAVKNLLAGEIYQTGHFFPPHWNYVNGDLFIVFGHLFILPLLPFFKNGFVLHAVSGLASAVIILGAAWLVSGIATRSTVVRLAFIAVVASGVSEVVAEGMFGQVSYGMVFYFAAFAMYFAWRLLNAEGRATLVWGGLLAATIVFAFWANPQRAVASYWLPLAAAIIIHSGVAFAKAGYRMDRRLKRPAAVLLLLVLSSVVGSLLHVWIMALVNNTPGAGAARWLNFENITQNFEYTIEGLLAILGAIPTAGGAVMSVQGMYEGFRLLVGGLLLILLPRILWRGCSAWSPGARFVAVFTAVSGLLFVFLHITTTIPDMRDPVTTARYLVPFALFCLLMLVVAVEREHGVVMRSIAAVAVMVLATSSFAPANPLSQGLGSPRADSRSELITLLEANDLRYGYATYWNSGALTVLSDESVGVRQIVAEGGLPKPMRHLSSNRWYQASAWSGPTFLMLTPHEAEQIDWELLAGYAGRPTRTIDANGFRIYVYPHNIAGFLPNWDIELERPLVIRASGETPHTTGKFDGPSGAMIAAEGSAGFLHFGPYATLVPGNYRADFNIEVTGAPGQLGMVDVTSNQGKDVHASIGVAAAGKQRVELPFHLKRGVDDLELRVYSSGAGNFKLYGITVERDEASLVAP